MRRGSLHAEGNRDRIVWSHSELGTVIDSRPREGSVLVALSGKDWEKTDSVFDHLILPGILPPLAARGIRAIHASSVQLQNGQGVMIAGPSGCGKTTAALMLVANGAKLVADDLTFIRRDEESFSIHGMGEGPRAVQQVWNNFSHWQPGKPDLVGKRRLHPNAIAWVPESRLYRVLLPSEHRSMTESVHAWMLTELIGYSYHAGDQDAALHQ
ncbi:hypothetical protein GF324_00015, partial [bacterium]|nr:hypothetical protein [bacterium]